MKLRTRKTLKFSLTIAVITFVLAAVFSIVSISILSNVAWIIGLVSVFILVSIGIIFDMLGVAATAAHHPPFHAMAAEKVPGAREAVVIIKNADKFASFSNDVIGDITGIVSGTATVVVVLQISTLLGQNEGSVLETTLSVLLTSFVAAFTVGGKALGKYFAINKSTTIIMATGKIISIIEKRLKIKLLPREDKRQKNK